MNTTPLWTLEQAIPLCQKLEPILKLIGYHLCLGGSVLYQGFSNNDLDLYVYKHQGNKGDYMDEPGIEAAFKLSGWTKFTKPLSPELQTRYIEANRIIYETFLDGKKTNVFLLRG